MPRSFVNASSNFILTGLGAGPSVFGFGTVAAIVRPVSNPAAQAALSGFTGSATSMFMAAVGGVPGVTFDGNVTGASAPTMQWVAADGWQLWAVTKATGSATPRFHKYVFSTGVWTHENGNTAIANGATTIVGYGIGYAAALGTVGFDGDIAMAGLAASTVLDDTQVESLSGATSAWLDLLTHLWILDQDVTSIPVIDLISQGNESSNSGPPGISTTSAPLNTMRGAGPIFVRALSAVTVVGAQATETDTANAGTPVVRPAGTQALETDTGNAGTIARRLAGTQALETDTASAGTPLVRPLGFQASETDTGNVGAPRVLRPGTQASEADTGAAGTAVVHVAGGKATETDTGNAGAPRVAKPGAQAAETDTGQVGAATATVAGGKATETDTANAGSTNSAITVAGHQATETDTARAGTPTVTSSGTQAVELDTGRPGGISRTVAGLTAVEVDTAFAGILAVSYPGGSGVEIDTGNAGTAHTTSVGTQALEVDTAFAGRVSVPTRLRVRVAGREPASAFSGRRPPSEWSGQEPATTFSGNEPGT